MINPHKQIILKWTRAIMLGAMFSISMSAFAAPDEVLTNAEALIRKGDFKSAYELLEPLESTRAGEIDFDYLFGVAAVESDHAGRGAFALERVLALDPNHRDARAEMAKAHFILGETEASKTEFNHVLQQNPDDETKRTVEKLLTAIQKIEGSTTTFGAFLGFGLGYDSNVSSAPNLSSVSVPFFGGAVFDLGDSGREQSDNFMNFSGGLSVRHPLSEQLSLFGAVSGNSKVNGSETAFDNGTLDFNGGLQYDVEKNSFSLALQDNRFSLGGENFRRAYGATAQWLHNLDSRNQAGVYAQYTRLKYDGNSFRDADRSIVGINVGHVFEHDYTPVLFGSLYGGREETVKSEADFLSQDILGLRLGGQLNFTPKWQLQTSLGVERRNNDEQDPTFLTRRKDNQYDASVAVNFIPARDWSIRPQLTYTKVDSNIDINSFDRHMFSVNVRKDFSW